MFNIPGINKLVTKKFLFLILGSSLRFNNKIIKQTINILLLIVFIGKIKLNNTDKLPKRNKEIVG
tara:strand:- start:847 stop:1041 length:195 start_codon:yes stop_codon:yes gene_type:complete